MTNESLKYGANRLLVFEKKRSKNSEKNNNIEEEESVGDGRPEI